MNYRELEIAAAALTPEQVDEALRVLARDPRFVGVIAWLERNERAWGMEVTRQNMAEKHGKLAHAAGSLHALQVLRAQLITVVTAKPRKQGPEQEGE